MDMSVIERLERVRIELDECSEQVQRLKKELTSATKNTKVAANTQLVGNAEIAEMTGLTAKNIGVMAGRGQLPEPFAELAGGRIWLRSDIVKWKRGRA